MTETLDDKRAVVEALVAGIAHRLQLALFGIDLLLCSRTAKVAPLLS